MKESDIQKSIRIALSPHGKFFRVNVGAGWTGMQIIHAPHNGDYYLQTGDVVIKRPRPFSTGTPAGFSDLIGAAPVVITPDMIGSQIAVFCALEIKTETGRVRAEQKNFIEVMQKVGCRAGIARSPEDAIRIVRGGNGEFV